MRSLWAALFLSVLAVFAAAQDRAADQPMILPVDATLLVATTDTGDHRFSIEIADDAVERSRGLMHRTDMPNNRGMLFVFEDTRPVSFWMKNTPMPLDLLFIGPDGRVAAIRQGVPFSEVSIAPGVPTRFVLELKEGTAAGAGITTGTQLRHPAIDAVAGRPN